ncbi:aldo/keto reductase [bacterium]|nr:aldo/keto reductase [bacterium]
MEYRKLGATGLNVSEICFGTATFGWHTDEAEAHRMLDQFLDSGCNFVDTADFYSAWAEGSYAGRSEEFIGTWLAKSGKRHQIVLATKVCSPVGDYPNDRGLSRRHIMDAVDASLRRLQTDFIDLYQTHSMDNQTPIEETMRALDDLVRQGKVRYLGCSNYTAWRTCKALWTSDKLGLSRFECTQPYYNMIDRADFERELADLVRAEQLAVIPYSPQAMGFLTGKHRGRDSAPDDSRGGIDSRMQGYFTERNFKLLDEMEAIGKEHDKSMAQVALGWTLTNPLITAPIVGARDVAQLQESIDAFGFRLSAEEMGRLDELTSWH